MSKHGPVAYVEIVIFAAKLGKCIIFVHFFMYCVCVCENISQNQLAKDGNLSCKQLQF